MQIQLNLTRPVTLLRTEGMFILIGCCSAYHLLFPHHWVIFACLFLVPDLSLLLFLRGPGMAASVVYNTMHSYALPALLGLLAAFSRGTLLGEVSLIWIGHIGMDRALGYGLKYPFSFKFTHIQSVANPASMPDRTFSKHK